MEDAALDLGAGLDRDIGSKGPAIQPAGNDDFARMWSLHEIAPPGMPATVIHHATMGTLQIQTVQASLDLAHGSVLALFDCKRLL